MSSTTALEPSAATAAVQSTQYATFSLDGRLFAVPIADVKEINTTLDITPVHHAPAGVRGLVNIRGAVFLILDLRAMMGYPRAEIDPENCLVLFKDEVGTDFGVLVDRIGDIIAIDRTGIVDRRKAREGKPPEGQHERRRMRENLIQGVAQSEKELVMVLRSQRLLEGVGRVEDPAGG